MSDNNDSGPQTGPISYDTDRGGFVWARTQLNTTFLREAACRAAIVYASHLPGGTDPDDLMLLGDTELRKHDRLVTDPLYVQETLNLDVRSRLEKWDAPFSSCAYLNHVLAKALGFEAPWIGIGTPKAPRLGVWGHLSKACAAFAPLRSPIDRSSWPALMPGDHIMIGDGSKGHAAIVLREYRENPTGLRSLLTANWGQPGGGLRLAPLTMGTAHGGVALYLGKRPIRRRLGLEALGAPGPARLPAATFESA